MRLDDLRRYYNAWFAEFDPDGEYQAALRTRMEAERREAEAWERVQQLHAEARLSPERFAVLRTTAALVAPQAVLPTEEAEHPVWRPARVSSEGIGDRLNPAAKGRR